MIKKIFILILLPFSLISQEKNAEYYANYASDSFGSGNFDLRLYVEYLTKAIELDSLNVDYYEQRSYAWQNLGNQIKAIEDFDKAISIYENDNQFKDIFDFNGNPFVFDIYEKKYYYLFRIGNLEDATIFCIFCCCSSASSLETIRISCNFIPLSSIAV